MQDYQSHDVNVTEMPTSGDLKSGDCLFFHYPPPPRKIDPAPNGNDSLHYMTSFLHDVHTIKIRNHHFDARNNLCQ